MKLLLLLVALQAQDPVEVRARLTPEEVSAGETAVLRVDVQTDGPGARIEAFRTLPPGLELQGSRSYDQRQFSLPGGTRRFVSREFVLLPRAPGRYRIPAVNVVVEGRTYTTSSEILTVRSAAGGAGGPGAPPADAAGAAAAGVRLRGWLSADTVYVGEQVTFNAEAMFSQDARLRLRRAPEYEPPAPTGFWVLDLPDQRQPTTRRSDGQLFEVQRFRRALFPLTEGVHEVPPARLEYEIRRGLLYAPETRAVATDTLRVVALPPPEPAPAAFTGAVGRYSLQASLEPGRVPAGEAAVLTVEIRGEGNLKALPPPELPTLSGVEVFSPGEESETEFQGGTVMGAKRFSWVLIPREPGSLDVPPIEYPHWDPAAEEYRSARSAALTLAVEPGADAGPADGAPTLRYLRTRPSGPDPLGWVRSPGFLAAQLAPLLLLGLAAGVRRVRKRRQGGSGSLRRRRRETLAALAARAEAGDRSVLRDADAFARAWVSERTGLDRAAIGAEALVSAGVQRETARALLSILDRMAAGRYAPDPMPVGDVRELVRLLDSVLERIDREAAARPSGAQHGAGARRARAGLGIVLFLMLLPPPGPARADAQSPSDGARTLANRFEAGRHAYDEERYLAAAEQFDAYLSARPEDPAGWYNLGNAYYHAGEEGRAVWAWLHVPRLDPRDADVRHNLLTAGVAPELIDRAAPPFPLRPDELFLVASLAWFATGLVGATVALGRGGRRARSAAGVLFFLALTLAGAGWASTREPDTLILLSEAPLRAAPALRAETVARLEGASGLVPVQREDGWIRVRTLTGSEGWIEAETAGEL